MPQLTLHDLFDQLRRIGWPWPDGTEMGALVDPCRDGWLLRLHWGRRMVETFVSHEAVYRSGSTVAWVRATDWLTKAMAREVGGVGLGPVAAALLEGLVPS